MVMTPPPFDPEIAAHLAAIHAWLPPTITPDMIPAGRQLPSGSPPPPTNEELAGDGRFEVEERAVPGPPGAPDVTVLICRPTGAIEPRPVLYTIHGGGMVTGTHRLGIPLDAPGAQKA